MEGGGGDRKDVYEQRQLWAQGRDLRYFTKKGVKGGVNEGLSKGKKKMNHC